MKKSNAIWLVICIALFLIAAGGVMGFLMAPHISSIFSTERRLRGTEFRQLVRHGRYTVYVMGSTHDEGIAIFDGNECLYMREPTTSGIEITHFEGGRSILLSEYSSQRSGVKRTFTAHKPDGSLLRSYVDRQGDGIWDLMLDFDSEEKFLWSNNSWEKSERGTSPDSSIESVGADERGIGGALRGIGVIH